MDSEPKGPPGIGEALSGGFAAYKANFGPVLIGTLCAMVCGMVPIVGGFLAAAGMHNVSLKAVRGIKPEPADGFIGFKKIVDYIVIGLLQMIGILACFVGQIVTQPLFVPGAYFIFDRDVDWRQAKDMCMAEVKPNLFQWVLFYFLLGIIGFFLAILGMLACIVGIVLVIPIINCAGAYAYNHAFGHLATPATTAPVPAPESNPIEQPAV